ncbi:MAG: terminase [Kouleothrix sp.]|jgi:phage terminase large subunit|nr:terminase [Kouleothrix sp.]
MPITEADIERELERRQALASIDAELERRSMSAWPTFRGAAAQLHATFDTPSARQHELMLAGPSETGKTFAALFLLDRLMRHYPGAQATICRKLRATMDGSVLNTWRRVIAIRGGVRVHGGEKPEWYDYSNGSRVWIAGLDNPGKALSSERDFIYVNQAEDLTRDDWQTLTTRATGRGAIADWTMVFGDCNPGPPSHWIVNRRSLKLLESRHEDNPSLFNDDGTITPQGERTLAILDSLEGVLKERLRYGRWVVAEGAVYAFDRALHLIDRMPEGWQMWRNYRAIDFGYNNPFTCLWGATDRDGRLYIYRQLYMTERTVDQHAETIKRVERWYKTKDDFIDLAAEALARKQLEQFNAMYGLDEADYWMIDRRTRQPVPNPLREKIESSIADHDAEDRATLAMHRIITIPAKKDISPGIQAVQKRLRKAGDGRPRLFVLRGALVERDEALAAKYRPYSLEQEFDTYVWPKNDEGKPMKEAPVKLYDHALDPLRYLVMHLDRKGGSLIR